MRRQEAEKLLAAFIFGDLDDVSKADLAACLRTDDELRDRLADMRMAAKVASDALLDGPEPVLNERRLKRLARLAVQRKRRPGMITVRRSAMAAAILGVVSLSVFVLFKKRNDVTWASVAAPNQTPYYAFEVSEESSRTDESFPTTTLGRDSLRHESADRITKYGGGMPISDEEAVNRAGAVENDETANTIVANRLDMPRGGSGPVTFEPTLSPPAATTPEMPGVSVMSQADVSGPAEPMSQTYSFTGDGLFTKAEVTREHDDVFDLGSNRLDYDMDFAGGTAIGKRAAGAGAGGARETGSSLLKAESSDEYAKRPMDEDATTSGTSTEEVRKSLPATTGQDSSYYGLQADYSQEYTQRDKSTRELTPEKPPVAEALSTRDVKDLERADEAKRLPEGIEVSESAVEGKAVSVDAGGKLRLSVPENELPPAEHVKTAAELDESDLPAASGFKLVPVNPWVMTESDCLSTFGLDVDTASYALCRRYIRGGFLPPAGAVRIEEFVNYFNYRYPQRTEPTFAVIAEAGPSPFADEGQDLTLLKIGVKARTIGRDQRKAAHLVFVVDTSASMGRPDRLPLVQQALDLLVGRLAAVDRVTLVTCADEARLHLESIPASEGDRIRQAVNAMQPSGATNLLAGLKLGYAAARRAFVAGRINHVVLCSDGVANVGATEAEAVLAEVAADRKQGITITCVGVGYGSYNDAFLEALADQGDGSYVFLDSAEQAQRVFVEQLAATLHTVAKDARIQVEFSPGRVRRYRLIGYENRDIEDVRFRDDTVDAGEVGSGQCSTALYELELTGRPSADRAEDLGTVFVRYRNADTGQIEEVSSRLSSGMAQKRTVESAPCFYLAAGAARFAELLRESEHAGHGDLKEVLHLIGQVSVALPLDRDVRELAELIRAAEDLPRAP
jgi:Ca-activated chloride channel family protein